MKIIYRGGYQTENADKSLFYEYADAIKNYINKGKSVVYVTFAKPDHYYDNRMIESLGTLPNIIDNSSTNAAWSTFDLIVMPGGEMDILQESLIKYGFSLDKLKNDVIIVGDSAGAYVLSKYYFEKEQSGDTIKYILVDGLNPKSNLITVGHIDNEKHCTPEKLTKAQRVADEVGARLLLLKENESMMFEDGEQVEFNIEDVLS